MARTSKDDKIIVENPGATPYELLTKGLSEKRYEQLLLDEKNKQQKQEPIKPKEVTFEASKESERLIPEILPSKRAMPRLQNHIRQQIGDQVLVKTPDGKLTKLHPTYAAKLVKKNPNYKIVG